MLPTPPPLGPIINHLNGIVQCAVSHACRTIGRNRHEGVCREKHRNQRFRADRWWITILGRSQLSQRGQQTNRTNTHGHWTPRRGGTRRSLLRPVITIHSSPVRSYCWPPHTRHYGHDTLRICNLRLNREYRSCSSICIQ